MPIPLDATQVPRSPNRIQLADGTVVTRHQALNLGAQYMGYKSHSEYRKRSGDHDKYMKSWLRTRQGKEALKREKDLAKAEGKKFNQAQFKLRLIAARNGQPNFSTGKNASPAYTDWLTRYGFTGGADYVRY